MFVTEKLNSQVSCELQWDIPAVKKLMQVTVQVFIPKFLIQLHKFRFTKIQSQLNSTLKNVIKHFGSGN